MSYDSLTNRGDYLSPHYLAEVLPRELAKKGGLRAQWAERDKEGVASPVKGLRVLKRGYFAARPDLADFAQRAADGDPFTEDERRSHDKAVKKQNDDVLHALGFMASRGVVDVERSGETFAVPVACHGQNVIAVDCGWAADSDAALDADRAGRLLDPVETGSREVITAGAKLTRWLFDTDEPPRYVLLLHGGVLILADRLTWAEGRYLAVSLDTAIDRADQPELETIAALFSADVLQPPAEGGTEQLAHWVDESRKHAVGVSAELREGLRESVQIIANEVLYRIRSHGLAPEDVAELGDLARELGREALRYLYRILFLLYAEARPELGILPADDQDYVAGYSMQRLGELVARRLIGEEARTGFHLYESLDLLFRMVNNGHRARGNASTEGLSEGDGLRFESLKADLFEPSKTRLIGRIPDPRYDDEASLLDTRLRDEALYKVLRRLMLAKGSGRKGKNQRGGFISYAQLGINQLGAVYEGLMSYSGFIATEELYEVAKKGDPSGGSWMIPASKVPFYADDVFVMEKDENGFPTGERVRYRPGSFVYRLAGRDRQTSASYYTPQSLTSVTVQLALEQRIKEERRPVSADEVLHWRVCEPALGSGAFLNEAIDQLAALYLRMREEETGDRLEPDERVLALQKIKAHIALHNCYGVDLNETAVELAEVSIWLNVMHRGLQAPWFGLHLVRGNSLIGAGRRLYPPDKLAKAEWLKSAPEDVAFSAGPIQPGHIHHFLLPAEGWGSVAGEKEAKELASEDTKRLADWRKAIRKPPSPKKSLGHKLSQVQRVQDLAGRAEYLWSLVTERLRISEREISRTIDVWGAENLSAAQEAKPRDEILEDLTSPGTPFWRLKTVMDAWCALWFWPVDKVGLLEGSDPFYATEPVPEPVIVEPAPELKPFFPPTYVKASLFDDEPEQLPLAASSPRKSSAAKKPRVVRPVVPLKDFEDWLDFAESVLGRQDIPADSLAGHFTTLSALSDHENQLEPYMGMDSFQLLSERFPWLYTVVDIAVQQGFFHWELRFAQVFSDGGFDLQLGNPPWVRPEWDEDTVLAERDPWFELVGGDAVEDRPTHRQAILERTSGRRFYLDEFTITTSVASFLANPATYPLISGTQPDFYRGFMCQTWAHTGQYGTVGLLHPDTHLEGVREGKLRAAAYHQLRMHASFVNGGNWAFPPPVDHNVEFAINIYGPADDVHFLQASKLYGAAVFTESLEHDGTGELPRVKYKGHWDLRPHRARVIKIDEDRLTLWQKLLDRRGEPLDETPLVHAVTSAELGAMGKLAAYRARLGDRAPRISSGYHEKGAKNRGLIREEVSNPGLWSEVVLQGPHFSVATPLAKQPPNMGSHDDPKDLTSLPSNAIPTTKYRRACDLDKYRQAQDQWMDRSLPEPTARLYSEFYRVAWRKMIADNGERSLLSALIPSGPAHIDSVISMALETDQQTSLTAGFFVSINLDYLLRVTGKSNLHASDARMMPVPEAGHPLAAALLLRTLRLNCLTDTYADLWRELYDPTWQMETWVHEWPNVQLLGQVSSDWIRDTPLRTEYERRAALVEIDALVAVWLGFEVDEFLAAYESRFGVLAGYEEEMHFDVNGRKLSAIHHAYGLGQTKDHWKQFEKYLEVPATNLPPDGYKPPFYKVDRIAEYRQAHAVFSERLRKARADGGTR